MALRRERVQRKGIMTLMSVGLGKTKNGFPEITVVERLSNGVRHHVVVQRSNGELVCDTAAAATVDVFAAARDELAWKPEEFFVGLKPQAVEALRALAALPAAKRDRIVSALRSMK